MNPQEIDRLLRIEALFDAALERPPGAERDAWLQEQCGADAGHLEETRPLVHRNENIVAAAPEPLPQFGPWRLLAPT